ncbi:HAD-IB family phosphatase [Acidithiobacillus sp. MC6.1]|uniref:HAD-IB family phosphatase n=2 Tax=Acidithiobacillus ferrivorans TaxID=160808 RepID=A0A7T5BH61_9PROT|nr:HAD-IB family phosphatase [Acidithiobacillus sp. MC6.1]QQD72235.1 HAD-IB family phosphatase [Acidithiobacillus ferrivorans]
MGAGLMQRAIFCDFDGTITEAEVFVALMRHFAPEAAARVLPEIYAQRLTLRDGLPQVLGTIPSRHWPELEDFVRDTALRPGLVGLLAHAKKAGIPFIVVTGGFTRMAEIVLAPYRQEIYAIHGLEVDGTGEWLRVFSPWQDDHELVAKAAVIAHYHPEDAVCIGDSITDLRVARQCPLVCARDRLAEYLREEGRTFLPFDDLRDVSAALAQRGWWQEVVHAQ